MTEFAMAHPLLSVLFLAPMTLGIAGGVLHAMLLSTSRLLRTVNVLFRGWPPDHLDADGDWRPEYEETEE